MTLYKRLFFPLFVVFLSLGLTVTSAQAGKKKGKPKSKLESVFSKVKRHLKYAYRAQTVKLEVPGSRKPDVKVKWSSLPKGFPVAVVKAMQVSSRERMLHARKSKGWTKLGRSRVVGKKRVLKGKTWWLFVEHRYSSNVVHAFFPEKDVVFVARGMYARGHKSPALLEVTKMGDIATLYRGFRLSLRKSGKYASFKVAVKGTYFGLSKPIDWKKLPKAMDADLAKLIAPRGRANLSRRDTKKPWTHLDGMVRFKSVWYKGKSLLLFSERTFYQNIGVYAYEHKTGIWYFAQGWINRRAKTSTYTLYGPVKTRP